MNGLNDGILIVVEGIDGAGKTTQVGRLQDALRAAGEDVISSHEPTNGRWGALLRQSAQNGRKSLHEEIELFTLDRRDHMERVVMPALNAGKVVILDRYFHSTIAYQGARGADVETLERQMREEFPAPDIVLLMDVHPSIGLERISLSRGEKPNHFERAESLAKVRQVFVDLQQRDPSMVLIDGHRSPDDVYSDLVHAMLDTVLKKKRCAKSYDCDTLFCSLRINGECPWWETRKRLSSQAVSHSR